MKKLLVLLITNLLFGYQLLPAQCEFVTPPSVKGMKISDRYFIFSELTINGELTTYMAVEKGEKIKISTHVASNRG